MLSRWVENIFEEFFFLKKIFSRDWLVNENIFQKAYFIFCYGVENTF